MREEFTFEVKDFVPTKRKKGLHGIIGIAVLAVVVTVILVAVFAYRLSKTPEACVAEGLVDFYEHTLGNKSLLLENLNLKTFDKSVGDKNTKLSARMKVKELGDLGLGSYEDYISDVTLGTDWIYNWSDRKLSGRVSVGYSLLSVSVLQASFADNEFLIGSDKFFKEIIGIKLLEIFSQLYFPEHRVVEALGNNVYSITALEEYVPEGDELLMHVTLNKSRQITKIEISLKGDKNFETCEILVNLTGKSHPTDEITLNGVIVYQGHKYNIDLSRKLTRNKNQNESTTALSLDLDGLMVTASASAKLDTARNAFSYELTGTDGVDELKIQVAGSIKAAEKIEFTVDSFTIYYSDELIADLKAMVTLEPSDSQIKSMAASKDEVIDIMLLNEDNILSMIAQIKEQIYSYKELLDGI